jgi:hypothetical protein
MFSLGNPIDPEVIREVEQELMTRPLPINKYRKNSGVGRSQAFGIVKQRNGTYTGSRLNFERPVLYQKLLTLASLILPPDFSYLSIQVNQNYQTAAHKDKGNVGQSCILGFGNYEGGDLIVEDTPISIKNQLVFFDGSKYLHSTTPFTGNRFSLVFFTPNKTFKDIPSYSFVSIKNKTYLEENYKEVKRVFNTSGKILETSDGIIPPRSCRMPTLRPCEE